MGEISVAVHACVAIGSRDEVVLERERDHEEGDDEEGAADDHPARFRNFHLRLLAHVDAEQVRLQERLPGETEWPFTYESSQAMLPQTTRMEL